ncbi:MAG: glycoside hydrolase family 2 protein [Flavobacteriales bacterium]|nr:glycoside hydrolase family 2 protein [Flavobacteriales bacterium]
MKYFFGILTLTILLGCSTEKEPNNIAAISLDGDWEFYYPKNEQWYPATVPGVIHTDLLKNGLIQDPFKDNNELDLQWIEQQDWSYRKTFQVSEEQLNTQHLELVFEGLDTYAEIVLNGQELLSTDNMFRSWRKDIKPHLKTGENLLEVRFTSPISYNREAYTSYPFRLPSGSETKEPRVGSFTRKAAYHFGWDWAPRFVTCGIWRSVRIEGWNKATIRNVHCITESVTESQANMKIILEFEADVKYAELTTIQIYFNDSMLMYGLKDGTNQIEYHFTVQQPQLWWCNGEGEPYLYDLNIRLTTSDQVTQNKSVRYGIRTIELVNEADSTGSNFYFKLNGKPVFMKGANYVPQDMFLPRVSESRYAQLIRDVKDANMNMLRVWGGGIYEDDLFYELCDENGILVWQDFMFAGSLYPNTEAFMSTVEEEVKENIIRLRNHPCIALWCGNNEIEVAFRNWGWQDQYGYSESDNQTLWEDYSKLFHQLIPELVKTYDPKGNYTPTTPLSNWGTPENFNHGSMHYWGVWHGKEPFENFDKNVGRFMVEYGFQSFPDPETLRDYISDSNMHLESEVMKNRQKSYIGNGLISRHIEQYYDTPKTFPEFIQRSQETQAKALQMAIEAHLSQQPRCMGSLFWQLNDCWPGPSWSVIDYSGRKKAGYFQVREAFSKR